MSGGFNFGQASTGFSFGAQKPAVAAPSTGFGMTSAMPAATGGGFAFGTPTQAAPNPTGSFSFGTPAKSTAAGGGFSFGTPAAPFGMVTPQPAAAPPQGLTLGTAVAPAPGSGFTMATGFSARTAAPAAGGFAFGTPQALPQAAVSAAPPTATVMATTGEGFPSFGGYRFGSIKVQATTAAPIAAQGGGFRFGTTAPSNLTMGIQPQTALTAAVTSQGGGFLFGIKPSSTPAPPASIQAVQAPGPSLFASPISAASAVAKNREKITALHKEMEKVKLDQRRLNQDLDFFLSRQKDLEHLHRLEESVKDQRGTIYMENADEERERTYKLAENIDGQLKRMSQDLKEIIEHLNTSSGPADTSDPRRKSV